MNTQLDRDALAQPVQLNFSMRTTTTRHSILAGVFALACALGASTANAVPALHTPLPPFRSADITGQPHHSGELRGQPMLVAVLTSSEAGDVARAWTQEADRRFRGTNVKLVTLVSLDLSPFVPTSMVRSAARDQTPRNEWHTTWIDRNGGVRRALGLRSGDHQPYLFAIDAQGRVQGWAHGRYDQQAADYIFSKLIRRR
jgi:predicted transcriptional regulator